MRGTYNRREILAAASATAMVGQLATWRGRAEEPKTRTPRVDTHLHCFAGTESTEFPYHRRAPYRPELPASPEFLIRRMDDAGVDFAIVVHPEPYQDDHRYLEHCLRVGDGRLKGTILLFCDREGSLEQMPALCEKMDIIAVRVHAYAPDRLPPFGSPELRRLWKMADELGIAVQLHFEPKYAAGFEPLIREFKNTTVLIDHLGRPFQGLPKEHEVVVKWSRFPNTVMKLSSIPTRRSYPHRDIQPTIGRLVEAFGAERMMYGGGFSAEATGQSYRAAFETARSYLSHLPEHEQSLILGGTACRLFRFES